MQRLEVSGAVRPIYGSLGVERLIVGSDWIYCDSFYAITQRVHRLKKIRQTGFKM